MNDSKELHKEFAIKSNGRIWALLERQERSQLEDDELLYAAYASCYHWLQAGTGVHQQRGEYLVSKAQVSLGHPTEALRHARRSMALTEQHRAEMKDFDTCLHL
jgi:organic hydroperoxide reductase OsmC/OhrA